MFWNFDFWDIESLFEPFLWLIYLVKTRFRFKMAIFLQKIEKSKFQKTQSLFFHQKNACLKSWSSTIKPRGERAKQNYPRFSLNMSKSAKIEI